MKLEAEELPLYSKIQKMACTLSLSGINLLKLGILWISKVLFNLDVRSILILSMMRTLLLITSWLMIKKKRAACAWQQHYNS